MVWGRGWQEVSEVGDFLLTRGLGCDIRPDPPREYYPEVDKYGAATFAEQTRMRYGYLGAERLSKTPEDDPWYDSQGDIDLPVVDVSGWSGHH